MKSKGEQVQIDAVEIRVEATGDSFWVTRHSVIAPYEDIAPRFESALRLSPAATDSNASTAGFKTPGLWPVVHNSVWTNKSLKSISCTMDERLFWSTVLELSRSRNFRELCFEAVQRKCQWKHCPCGPVHLSFWVQLVPWNAVMDKSWNTKIGYLVAEQVELENAMAWLSTLGGAYSALGDNSVKFAEAASQVSVQQLRLALRIGDPATLCRCRIYIAMSLLQRGYFRPCRRLLREQYRFAVSAAGQREPRLAKMCQSVWDRMRYLRSLAGKPRQA